MTTDPRDPDRLEARIKEWGRRDPATPAATASRRVVQRLADQARPRPWPRRIGVAAAACLAGLAVWVTWPLDHPPRGTRPPLAAEAPAPLPSNVVQFWLDPETPVYFVTGPLAPVE
jgi:hypothetical protein